MERAERRLVWGLVALAIVVRAAAVIVLQSHTVPRSSYEHGEIAANLLAGRGFSTRFLGAEGPTSQQAPVYPALVAVAYALGGVDSPRALLLLELSQAALGGVLVLGVLDLSGRIFGSRRLAIVASGTLAAIHPTLIYAATHVQVALLGATLLTWVLAWAYRTGATGRVRDAVVTGALLSLLALTDPILALAAVGVAAAIALGRKDAGAASGKAVRLVAATLLAAGTGVAPWIVRNAVVHGEFVAIKSTFGYAFWQGNCALSEGTDKVVRASVEKILESRTDVAGLSGLNRTLWRARHEAGYLDDVALTRQDRERLGSVTEPERSRILFRRAMAELREQPGRYLTLCLRRFRVFWLFDETNPKTRVLAYRVSHMGLLALALAGLVLSRREVRARLMPTLATAGLIALFHTMTIVSARFHVPIEPLMAVWAGAGLTRWAPAKDVSAATRDHVVGVRLIDRLECGRLIDRLA